MEARRRRARAAINSPSSHHHPDPLGLSKRNVRGNSFGEASFNVEVANGDRFARLLRMRIEWHDPASQTPVALYGENYFDLFPGEKKEIAVDVVMPEGFTGTATGTLILEGTNISVDHIPVSLAAGW